MPLPLIFIGAAALAGAFGVGKSIKAGVDMKDAKDTNALASETIEKAKNKIDFCRKNCGKAFNDLGKNKIRILDRSIKPFIEEFEKLNHIELEESAGLNELQNLILDTASFEELKELQTAASSIAGGLAAGTVAGAVTAAGAYGAAGAFAAASTGTAISTLSGAAATNATLAFFGGGSLAAGGLGIAGGTAILGGLVAAPALAILGVVVGAKASANKNKAYANLAEAKKFEAEMDTAAAMCIGIRRRASMFNRFLLSLHCVFEPLFSDMCAVIQNSGTDFSKYTDEEKQTIAKTLALAGAIKAILDTPILDAEGNLTTKSEKIVGSTQRKLKKANIE